MADPALPAGFQLDQSEPPVPEGFSVDAPKPSVRLNQDQVNAQLQAMVKGGRTKQEINQFASDNGATIDQADLDRAVRAKDARVVSRKDVPYRPHTLWQSLTVPGAAAEDQKAVDDYTRAKGSALDNGILDLRKSFANTEAGIIEGVGALPDLAIKGVGWAGGGLARLFGAPPEIVHGLENPVTIGGIGRSMTGAPENPEGAAGYARAGARGLGGLITGLGVAGQLKQAASPVVRGVGNVLASNPGAQAVGAVTGAEGAEVARQSGASPLVQTLVGMGTGGLGGIAAEGANAVTNAGRNVLTDRGATIRAGQTLAAQADNLPIALSRIDDAAPQVSGATPTLAEVSRDPGLAGFQRSFASTNQKQGASVSLRQQDNAAARMGAVDRAAGTGSTQAVQDTALEQGTALATAARTAAEATGPSAYPETSGSSARALLDAAHDQARGVTSAAYSDGALTTKVPVTLPDDFFGGVAAKLKRFYGDAGGEAPPELRQIVSDIATEGNNSTALTNLDRRLADFAGRMRMTGSGREATFAEGLRHDLAAVADQALPPEQRAALATAKAARREQADGFETGAIGKALSQEQYGRPRTPDSAIPQVLIPKGRAGGEAVTQLVRSIGAGPAENVVREEIRRQMDGATTATAIARLRNEFAPVLRQFPALSGEVEAAHGQMALAEAFPRSPLGRFADWSKSPGQVVSTMLAAKDGGRAFTNLVQSLRARPAALDGLRRAVHDYIADASKSGAVTAAGDQAVSTAGGLTALRNALDRDQGAGLFTSPQRQALTQIRGEMEGAQFANTANRTAGSDTARNQMLSGAGRLLGHSRTVRVVRVVMDLMNNQEQTNALIGKAILDPKFAAELIRNVPPKQAPAVAARLVSGLTGSAEAVVSVPAPPPEEPQQGTDF